MMAEKDVSKSLKKINKIYEKKYGKKYLAAGWEIDTKWNKNKIFKVVEQIVRATEICTLNHVMQTGTGSLNDSYDYPYWRFSADREWRHKMYRNQVKLIQQKILFDVIDKNFRRVRINGKLYFTLKSVNLKSSYVNVKNVNLINKTSKGRK